MLLCHRKTPLPTDESLVHVNVHNILLLTWNVVSDSICVAELDNMVTVRRCTIWQSNCDKNIKCNIARYSMYIYTHKQI